MEERHEESKLDANVEAKIKELLIARGIIVENIDMCPATIKGDNYLGVLTNLNIAGQNSDGTKVNLKWIVKSAPKIEALRDIVKVDLLYAREIYVYEETFKLFEQFQEEKALQRAYHDYPKFIGSYVEPPNESIIMENMKSIGYIMKDRRQPLDLNHVMLVMKSYGKLHSLSYAIKDQNYDEFQRIVRNSQDGWFIRSNHEEMKKANEPLMEESLKILKSEDQRIIDIYCNFAKKSVDVAMDTQRAANNDLFSVIVHGDSWINNLLFKYGNNRNPATPTQVCLLDWQLSRYGSPAFDLSYFIFASTDKTLRRQHYDDMIRTYYDSLQNHLKALGSDPDKLFSFDDLLAQLKRYSVIGFYMAVMVLRIILREIEEIPEWREGETLDDMINKMKMDVQIDGKWEGRTRDVIVDVVEKGYLDFLN